MKIAYEELMEIIEIERHDVLMCAEKAKRLMKKTFNPFRKLNYYRDAKRLMAYVFGMDLIMCKIRKNDGGVLTRTLSFLFSVRRLQ